MQEIAKSSLTQKYYQEFPLKDYFGFDILPFTSLVRFDSDEKIFKEGFEATYLYYLIKGKAKLFLSHENGRTSLINFIDAPCFIGEMELIGAQDKASGVTAITPCTCFRIDINRCKEKLLNDAKFLRYLCLFLSKKAIGNTYNYSLNQSYCLDIRLANFILLTEKNGYYREKHTEVAEYLGVTYRHLLYVLAEFVKKGILEKSEKGYFIADRNTLKQISTKK